MFPCVDTYRLTNLPTMLGGRAKEIKHQILYLSRQRPKGQKLQQPNQSKDSVQNAKLQPAQVKRLTKQRGITLCPQPRENALKVALIIQRRYKRRSGSKPAPSIQGCRNVGRARGGSFFKGHFQYCKYSHFCPNFVTFAQIMILEYISDMTKKLSEFLRQKPILS